jgi:S-DNA-T family DNA segregation ATPase FtsK/SpoIIIE
VTAVAVLVLVLVALALAVRAAWAVVRFARLPHQAKGHFPAMVRARVTWRWFCRNATPPLAYHDKHRSRHHLFGLRGATGVRVRRHETSFTETVRYPRAVRWRLTPTGWTTTVRSIPGVGRPQLEAAAVHIQDAWRVQRVSISQPRPGRVVINGMVRDVMLTSIGSDVAPPGTYDGQDPSRIWLGRDEHGIDRWLDLKNISGVVLGGQPGGGKSQAITSWLCQLAPSPAVQFVTLDGKGAGEFDDFAPRAWITAGDSVGGALDVLEQLAALMYDRLRVIRDFTGGAKNIWSVGVSAAWPLIFAVVDETQQYLDMPAAKARGKEDEKTCARMVTLASDLVRKGRSVGFCTLVSTQKPTSDSLPSSISSNCALSMAFSLRTLDAAKAALGQDIGNYPSLSPVALSLPDYAGVAVASLMDGMVPFTRIRSPLITEDQAVKVSADTADLRKDPAALLPGVRLAGVA